MAVIRVVLGMLIAVAVVVAAIPAVILVDLVSGGTGLGLCEDGLGRCTTSGFALAELIIILGVAAVLIGGGIAACVRLLQRTSTANPPGPESG